MSEQTASERAAASGEPVEVTAERTEYTTTMADPDGTFVMTQATEPQRARTESGGWQDIDATLEKRSDGTVGPKSTVVDLSFSGGGSGSDMLKLGHEGQGLQLGWPTNLPAPTLKGATATYADVPILDFGRPPEHGLRDIMDAILYADRTGVQWRHLPHWNTDYGYFAKWADEGVFCSPSSTACSGSC